VCPATSPSNVAAPVTASSGINRWAACLLVLLCLGTAFGVHLPPGDMDNMMDFYKNLVMAGGFLYVINFGAGAISFDEGVTAR
jgi:uncharacterized membrane protein YphA (DoxX/SURF4 family)